MEKDCVVVDGSATSNIKIDGDELIISRFIQRIKIGKAVIGAS